MAGLYRFGLIQFAMLGHADVLRCASSFGDISFYFKLPIGRLCIMTFWPNLSQGLGILPSLNVMLCMKHMAMLAHLDA